MKIMGRTALAVAALTAVGVSPSAVAQSGPQTATLPVAQGPCAHAFAMPAAGPGGKNPAGQSCSDARQQCLSDSAQESTYGGRYVPPEATAMCLQAYRECINADSSSGSIP